MVKIHTQDELPGIETERIPAIEKAAKALYEVRSERMQLTEDETDKAGKLIGIMRENKLEEYQCHTFDARIKIKQGKDTVSVRIPKAEEDDDDE